MKKLLIITLLTASTAQAGNSTGDVRFPFIANGSFKGLCDRLEWTWGDLGTNKGCFSSEYAANNGYILVNGEWMQDAKVSGYNRK